MHLIHCTFHNFFFFVLLFQSTGVILAGIGLAAIGFGGKYIYLHAFALFDFILYIPSTIFQLCRDRSSWVEPVLS